MLNSRTFLEIMDLLVYVGGFAALLALTNDNWTVIGVVFIMIGWVFYSQHYKHTRSL